MGLCCLAKLGKTQSNPQGKIQKNNCVSTSIWKGVLLICFDPKIKGWVKYKNRKC